MKPIPLQHALDLLRSATGPSEALQRTIPWALADRADYSTKVEGLVWDACGGDVGAIDACIELAAFLLPGANWLVAKGRLRLEEPPFGARILDGEIPIGEGESDSLPIAFLIAILSALIAKGRK